MANKPFLPGRGRRSISDAPGSDYGEKWHQQLEMIEKPKSKNKPKELRLVGGVYTLNQHYIKFTSKAGKATGYYEVCLNFDPITGTFRSGDDAVCPICRDFTDQDLPDDLRMYGTFRYYSDAFDIDRVKAGVQDGCFGVIWSNKYGKNDWVKIASTMPCEVDDLEGGCTVHWFYDEHAKDNKDKMSFTKGEPLPVLWNAQKHMLGIRTSAGVFTGTPTDFESIVKLKSPSEIERDLTRLQLYKKLEEFRNATQGGYHADDSGNSRGGRPQQRSAPPPQREEAPVQDELFAPEAPSGGRSFGKSDGGGDGWDTPAPAPAAPAAPAPAPAARSAAPPPADDGWGNAPAATAPTTSAPDEDWGAPPASGGGGTTAPPDDDFSSFGGFSDSSTEDAAPKTEPVDDGW